MNNSHYIESIKEFKLEFIKAIFQMLISIKQKAEKRLFLANNFGNIIKWFFT